MKKHTGYVDDLTKYKIGFDANEAFMEMRYPCLTKENFWNKLMVTCPDSVRSFCNWIDEYKSSVLWNALFNSDSEYQNAEGKNAKSPKFHDLPFPIQYGILCEYIGDMIKDKHVGRGFSCPQYSYNDLNLVIDEIILFFMAHQAMIDCRIAK